MLCSCLLNKLQLLQKGGDMELFCNLTSCVLRGRFYLKVQPVICTGENKTSTGDLWDGVVNDYLSIVTRIQVLRALNEVCVNTYFMPAITWLQPI